eukprot:scaffold443143_cov19-Prasinocladus_malaysianus.AAC.1
MKRAMATDQDALPTWWISFRISAALIFMEATRSCGTPLAQPQSSRSRHASASSFALSLLMAF